MPLPFLPCREKLWLQAATKFGSGLYLPETRRFRPMHHLPASLKAASKFQVMPGGSERNSLRKPISAPPVCVCVCVPLSACLAICHSVALPPACLSIFRYVYHDVYYQLRLAVCLPAFVSAVRLSGCLNGLLSMYVSGLAVLSATGISLRRLQ